MTDVEARIRRAKRSLRLTRRGWVALAIGVVAFFAAFPAGRRELLVLAGAALVISLGGLLVARWRRPSFEVIRLFSPPVVSAGRTVRVTVRIRNSGSTPSPALVWRDTLPWADTDERYELAPVPASSTRLRTVSVGYDAHPPRRGVFPIGPLLVEHEDPFGMARSTNDVGTFDKVIVVPAVTQLPAGGPILADGEGSAQLVQRRVTGNDDDLSTREYRPGDALRRVHWRASARHDQLMVRQEEHRSFPDARIVLDTRIGGYPDSVLDTEVWPRSVTSDSVRMGRADVGLAGRASRQCRLPCLGRRVGRRSDRADGGALGGRTPLGVVPHEPRRAAPARASARRARRRGRPGPHRAGLRAPRRPRGDHPRLGRAPAPPRAGRDRLPGRAEGLHDRTAERRRVALRAGAGGVRPGRRLARRRDGIGVRAWRSLTSVRPPDARSPRPAPGLEPGAAGAAAAPPRRRANLTPWRNAGLVAGALLAALGGLHVVLRELSWWTFPAIFVVVVLAAVAFARGLMRSRLLPSLIGLGVGVAVLTFAYAAESAILGIIPMPGTFERFKQLWDFGIDSIAFQTIRATPELGIVFLISVLMIASALISELLIALRHPSFVFIPLVVILIIPAIVEPGLSDAFWYIVAAAFYLAILRIGARPSSVRATWAAGAMVIIGSLIMPFIIPGIDDSEAPTVSGLRAGVNPLIDLGSNLRRGDIVLAATYNTSNSEGAYLRLATLDDFNGRTWTPNMVAPTEQNAVDEFPDPSGLTAPVAREELTADITVFDITGNWLPVPYPASSIEGLDGNWHWEESGLAVRSADTTVRGQDYRVEFLDVEPTLDQLQSVLPAPEGAVSKFLEVPRQMPPIIAETAHEIADGFDTAYDRATAIQEYFHGSDFHYSEDAPVRGGYDGEGADVIGVFLDKKVGYCVHYASAMAIMARVMGIPSRIAVGFQPGERSFDRGQTTFSVNSDDLHAWPELYFAGIGWLRFEPTPGRGTVPSWGVAAVDDPNTPQNEGAPLPSPSAVGVGPERPDESLGPNQAAGGTGESNPAGAISLTVLGVLVLLALTPMGLRTGIRRWRYRAMRTGTDAASAAWRELRDTAHDYGWSAPETETPRELEERLAVVLSGDRDELARFRGSVEASAYGRPDAGTISVDELRAVRKAIARATPWQRRLRIALLPPSLVARARAEDD